jgi:hypothetical protein
MDIKFKIVKVVPEEHQIMVRYYSDTMPEEKLVSAYDENGDVARYRTDYMITLPIPVPTGDDLDAYIMRHCPVGWFDTQEKIANPKIDTTMDSIKSLIGKEKVVKVDLTPPAAPQAKK